jgi:hypothetical protein
MTGDEHLKVRIRDASGRYLVVELANAWFTDDPHKATVFDYHRHQIAAQLQLLLENSGIALQPEAVDPREVYEVCDGCNRYGMPFDLVFDGHQFLCRECLNQRRQRSSSK